MLRGVVDKRDGIKVGLSQLRELCCHDDDNCSAAVLLLSRYKYTHQPKGNFIMSRARKPSLSRQLLLLLACEYWLHNH